MPQDLSTESPEEMPAGTLNSARHLLSDERDQLELEKLRLEIRELQKPWWKRPPYLAIIVPIWISLFAVLGAWANGWFDRERQTLKKDKVALQADLSSLRLQITRSRESLASTQALLIKERERVGAATKLLATAKQDYSSLALTVQSLSAEKSSCNAEMARLNTDFERQLSRLTITMSALALVYGAEKIVGELGAEEPAEGVPIQKEIGTPPKDTLNPAAPADQKAPLSGR